MNFREPGNLSTAAIWRRPAYALAFVIICLAAVPVLAQQGATESARLHRHKRAEAKMTPAIEKGQKTFEGNCAFCHGEDATGGRGPDLVRSALVAHDQGGNLIGPVILNGRPSKGMPPFHLSETEITDIAAFLHYRQLRGLESAGVPTNYALKWLLTGNAVAGKTYFDGAGKCKDCHSPTGDLAHVASKYEPLKLETRMLYPEGVQRTVTVTLPSGEKLEGPLLHLDEFTVALRDSSGWYRSFPLSRVKVNVHDPVAAHRKMLDELSQADIHNLFAYLETLK